MSNVKPLLSIVIATRNRIPYAISAIQSILAISDERLELVVQDNSESRELEDYVCANISDERFRYRYTAPPFSSIDNFNAAIELSSGEYVCLIGDDDGVNPEIIEAADWASCKNIDALSWPWGKAHYIWPDAGSPSTVFTRNTAEGHFVVKRCNGSVKGVDTESELRRIVKNGGLYYHDYELPKVYHGLVRRRCLDAIREKTGAYFCGLSPDIYAALTIACVAKCVQIVDYPLSIAGSCRSSSSITENRINMRTKKLEDAPHFRDRGKYVWDHWVPQFYAAETIWAESGITALREVGRDDLLAALSLPKLAVHCVAANREGFGGILRTMLVGIEDKGNSKIVGCLQFAWLLFIGSVSNWVVRIWRRLWNIPKEIIGVKAHYKVDGLNDMSEVTAGLVLYLKQSGKSFQDCIREDGDLGRDV
jgi:glycosyltransferase involved in cell wall biosynthesis